MAHISAPREQLQSRLQTLNQSQQSVEGTSKWLLFYSQDAAAIVKVWFEEFLRAPADRKLALLYLANHVLQEGRKKDKSWAEEFAKIIVPSLRDFAKRADDKAKNSGIRLVKIWEERRVFSPSQTKDLKEALKAAPAVKAPQGSAAKGAGEEQKKAQAPGRLQEVLQEVAKAEQHAAALLNRAKQIKTTVASEGTMAEVSSARDVFSGVVKGLQQEAAARRKAVEELKAQLAKQEAGVTRAEEQVRSFEGLHAAVEERYKQHEQQRQQQQQQQAQQQAQKQAQQQAPLMMGGMAIDPMVLAGMAGQLGIAMPNVPNPMGMMMGMPQMPQMPQMPMGMVPVPMPGMGQAGGAGAGAMPGGVVPMPGMGAAPQPGVAGAGQGQGQAAASDFRGSLGAGVSGNGMGGGGGGGGTGVAGPSGGGEGGMGMGGASPSLAGGQFGLSDDIAAQLAAHLQSTNHDALATLAKSLAEFNGTGEADGSGGAGVSGPGTGADPLSLGLGLGTDFEAGDMGFPPLTGGDTGSPLAPALDEYDPDDPI